MNFERLSEVRDAYKEKRQLEEKIIEFENMRISPRAAVYGTERVQTYMKGDIQPDNIARIDEIIEEYNEKLRECIELILDFENSLSNLNARERRILRYYYVDCMTWEQICVKMHLSWTNIHRIRRAAIYKITGKKSEKN